MHTVSVEKCCFEVYEKKGYAADNFKSTIFRRTSRYNLWSDKEKNFLHIFVLLWSVNVLLIFPVYVDLVLPLLKKCPRALDVENYADFTPRQLLRNIKEKLEQKQRVSSFNFY